MTDCDEKQASQRVSPLLEPGSREGGLLTKRRQFVKGVALGLPAILTLPRGAAAAAQALTSSQCDQKIKNLQTKPADFNPNSPNGTWLTQTIQVQSYTQTIAGTTFTIKVYTDIVRQPRVYDNGGIPTISPGDTINLADWSLVPNSATSVPALAYYGPDGTCVWYGPKNPHTDATALTQSCCKSLHPNGACTNNTCG